MQYCKKFNAINDRTGKDKQSRDQNLADENNVSEENEEKNRSRNKKNDKHPGSQRGGGKRDGKQKKKKIAMQISRENCTKAMKAKHIEYIKSTRQEEKNRTERSKLM